MAKSPSSCEIFKSELDKMIGGDPSDDYDFEDEEEEEPEEDIEE